MQQQNKAYIFAILTVLIWSTVSTAFKLALFHASVLTLISYAMLVASIVLFFFVLITKEYKELKNFTEQNYKNILIQTAILYFYHIVLFIGYAGLPVQIALPINYFWTILLAIFGAFFLKQKMQKKVIFWLFFAFSGIILISFGYSKNSFSISYYSLVNIALSPILYALYWVFATKDQSPAMLKLFICFSLCSLIGFIHLLLVEESFSIPSKAFYPIIYIGLFELSIPFILWYFALKYTNSIAKIATIPLCSPFLSLLWANIVLGEEIKLINFIGLIIIVVGTLMQQRLQK